ncbi:Asp23/Gls24 family envelope stress response protein [Streptomyces sp. NPDC005438]|uniref:Asp23/Gls24 family envelope stress response protein n=1 Tax=Streptomyces sp. NPDC005438 TaxID=3156880 RepID=UPI0033ABD0C8
MAAETRDDALIEAVTRAVLEQPGVAFLQPGIADLLRNRARTPGSGVRVRRGTRGYAVELHVVLRRGYRALDVTRRIRAAVQGTVAGRGDRTTPDRVTVTVVGVV